MHVFLVQRFFQITIEIIGVALSQKFAPLWTSLPPQLLASYRETVLHGSLFEVCVCNVISSS
jgi:hypothetical protein